MLRSSQPKPPQGFGVKKYDNKYFTELIVLPSFEKSAKRLIKKYKSLGSEISYMVTIYDKSEISSVSKAKIEKILRAYI